MVQQALVSVSLALAWLMVIYDVSQCNDVCKVSLSLSLSLSHCVCRQALTTGHECGSVAFAVLVITSG